MFEPNHVAIRHDQIGSGGRPLQEHCCARVFRVVVGVSGGADSLCLLHVLNRLCGPGKRYPHLELHVAHLNHLLRGAASSADADYVAQLAASWKLPATIGTIDVPALARTERRTDGENKTDRLDAEDAAFHTRVREAYLQLASEEPDRVRIIDATGSVNEIHQRVLEITIPFLEKQNTEFRSQNSE